MVPRKKGTMKIPAITSEKLNNELILRRLRMSNPQLYTSKWKIYSISDSSPSYRICVVAVDFPSIQVLRKLDFMPFYALGRASVWINDKTE